MPLKRIQYHRYGGPEEMRLETYDLPGPGGDEILVRVKASSVNPVDWKIRQGAMKLMTGRRFPRAMGTDFSGVVEQVGANVTRFRAGDEVFGTVPVKPSGAFAHALITKEKLAVNKPASISHEAAAALPVVGATAWRGCRKRPVEARTAGVRQWRLWRRGTGRGADCNGTGRIGGGTRRPQRIV